MTDVSTSVAVRTSFEPMLRKLGKLAQLSTDDASVVRALPAHTRIFPKKTDIAAQLRTEGSLHVLANGWAVRSKSLPDGQRQITGLFLPGEFINWPADGLESSGHSVEALTRCEILSLATPSFESLFHSQDGLSAARQYLNLFEQAVLREWIVSLCRRDARGRIAHLICEIHERLRMAGRTLDRSFDFPIRQSDLADASGLTAVHVNKC